MNVIACYPVLYGSDYLAYSIRSLNQIVQGIYVSISRRPWANVVSPLPAPETVAQIQGVLSDFRGKGGAPIFVRVDDFWGSQQAQYDWFETVAKEQSANLILRMTPDEVWEETSLRWYLEFAKRHNYRAYGVPVTHLWRSFDWMCQDGMYTDKIINVNAAPSATYCPELRHRLYNFGYARKPYDVLYKSSLRWYRSDWRLGWFERKFLGWPYVKEDLHPFCEGIWTAKPIDRKTFPTVMREHPYWGLEII